MTPTKLAIDDVVMIGRNEHYNFAVGRLGARWIGFARSAGRGGTHADMVFLFPEVSEGVHLGVSDRHRAILLTGALAQDPGHSYGGISEWFVPPQDRGDPEKCRCENCSEIGCQGVECAAGDFQP